MEGFCDNSRYFAGISSHIGMFNNRESNAINIGFLESIGTDGRPADLTGDNYHRDGVHVCVSDACHQIGRPGAGSAETDSHFAGGPSVGIGGMGGRLFVAH